MYDLTPIALTVNEVAQLLGIGRDSAYALVRCGAIHSVRIGRLLRVPRSEVDRFLTEGANQGYQTIH